MPAFLPGVNYGKIISETLKIPINFLSHQENHIYSSAYGVNFKLDRPHISVHISGGTTEILICRTINDSLIIDKIGGSLDLSFGQLIDRIGLSRGIDFPCGKNMDLLSKNGKVIDFPKVKTNGFFNISGLENFYKNKVNLENNNLFYTLFFSLSKILEDSIFFLTKKYDIYDVLLVGGVSSNTIIKNNLTGNLKENGIKCYIPNPIFCTDNAIGAGIFSLKKYNF